MINYIELLCALLTIHLYSTVEFSSKLHNLFYEVFIKEIFLKNIYLFIYLFIYGCVGSSFLCEGFL